MNPIPPGPFQIIYADPPWSFKTWSEHGMGRSPKYKVMTKAQIAAMAIREIAAPD